MGFSETEKNYEGKAGDYQRLADELEKYYRQKNFTVQVVSSSKDECMVQMKNEDLLKNITGLSEALSVTIRRKETGLIVGVGKARWLDKLGVGLFGTFVILAPLTLTAGYGAYKQYRLVDETWDFINRTLGASGVSASGETSAPTPSEISHVKHCPSCGKENPESSRFCSECGKPLDRICPQCGAALPESAKFCVQCGTKTDNV